MRNRWVACGNIPHSALPNSALESANMPNLTSYETPQILHDAPLRAD